ncbi:MAG: hypothetical protein QOK43_1462 [Acidimicrobiaceae bacterium]|nr:hypothetical protein [Acidimicrobiaceae bacterium]
MQQRDIVIIGAGPAGLTAAYQLVKRGQRPIVLEADSVVGGISRTVEREGWRFDIGGHRFFTKVDEVEALWREILPEEEFLTRPRMSRIYYSRKFFDYPLKAGNALKNLGVLEALRCVLSYVWAKVRPPKDQSTLEGWVAARFGFRLYRIFFKTYTEKVWGVPANEIQADWAAQRIKSLSLGKAIVNALMPKRGQTDITSLIEEFRYPKHGPGMMWERCRELVEAGGGQVLLHSAVQEVHREDGRVVAVTASTPDGLVRFPCDDLVSTMPIGLLVKAMDPPAPVEVVEAADSLTHRDFLTVALVVPAEAAFPDNWIYVHAPDVRVGRIQNFGSWSPYMVKDGFTCLGLEYFVFEGDDLWTMSDEDLVKLGTQELEQLQLIKPGSVSGGYVVRMPKAYPVYDEAYQANVEALRKWLSVEVPNCAPVGRNGMHRYNNQDHSMLTAMLAVENIYGADHDVWDVNVDDEYHEERKDSGSSGTSGTGRDAPVVEREVLEAARETRVRRRAGSAA